MDRIASDKAAAAKPVNAREPSADSP